MAPPSAFLLQYASVPNCILSWSTRWLCSKAHAESQPSRFVALPSSHCSPCSRVPFPQTARWQLASQVPALGGSHCSPREGSVKPSPHVDCLHVPPRQMFPVPHVAPFPSGN